MTIIKYVPTKYCGCAECHRKLVEGKSYRLGVNRRYELICRECLIKLRNTILKETQRRDS